MPAIRKLLITHKGRDRLLHSRILVLGPIQGCHNAVHFFRFNHTDVKGFIEVVFTKQPARRHRLKAELSFVTYRARI